MLEYTFILYIAYILNIVLVSHSNLMIKNITLFNYKNSVSFTSNKFFFDIFYSFFYNKKNFIEYSYSYAI